MEEQPRFSIDDEITDGQYTMRITRVSKNHHGIIYCGKMTRKQGMCCIHESDKVKRITSNRTNAEEKPTKENR